MRESHALRTVRAEEAPIALARGRARVAPRTRAPFAPARRTAWAPGQGVRREASPGRPYDRPAGRATATLAGGPAYRYRVAAGLRVALPAGQSRCLGSEWVIGHEGWGPLAGASAWTRAASVSPRPMAPRPTSRCRTWISQWAPPGSNSVWVMPRIGTTSPQTTATATRPRLTPALAASPAWVHRASTRTNPVNWCNGTRLWALPVQNSTPRTSRTTAQARIRMRTTFEAVVMGSAPPGSLLGGGRLSPAGRRAAGRPARPRRRRAGRARRRRAGGAAPAACPPWRRSAARSAASGRARSAAG